MSHGLKILLMAAGAIITCIVVVIGFQITKSGKKSSNDTMEQYRKASNQYELMKDYDGRTLGGKEVIDLMIDNEKNDIYFLVKTKECVALMGVYYNRSEDLSNIGPYNIDTPKTDADYINETSLFDCIVLENANGIVVGMKFIQR